MVSNSRAALPTSRIRRLSEPQQTQVRASKTDEPEALLIAGQWCRVQLIRRPWRIDQLWWTEHPIIRMYFQVARDGGPPLTVYRDLLTGEWREQRYG
jgi:hypothetical protein